MTDDDMSKPRELIYRAFFEELRFAKQQQWQISYYTMTLFGAILTIAKARSNVPTSPGSAVWCSLVTLLWVTALFLIFDLQSYIRTTRRRQTSMEKTFNSDDRRLADPRLLFASLKQSRSDPCMQKLKKYLNNYERVATILALAVTLSGAITFSIIALG